ncbi:MAG TPA: hypothetical protein DCM87_20610 [Planctomycetes bacterium]|nr:hypothetical protein [Planctomycetota bacterium]
MRAALTLSLALAGSVAFGPALRAAAETPWFERSLVGMEVGPTGAQFGSDPTDTGYAARFDGRDIVERCARAHCEYLVIWARDGEYAYYDSRVVAKCPGLGSRDVLKETVEAAAAHALPVIAYCVVQQGGRYLEQHPEFAMRDAHGAVIPGRFCYNSGYLDVVKRLATEMLAYGIAGFHIDMLDQGFGPPYGCFCAHCAKRFESEYAAPMPKGVTWDDAWDRMLEFRARTSARFERELRDHIKAVDPRASVDFNYHGNPPFSWEVGQLPVLHAVNGDFVTGETGVWGFSALGVGLNAEFYRAATPGLPFQVAMQRGVRMYHDQTTRPLADIRWELLTLLAHGAFATVVDKTGYDGRLDPVAYDRIGAAFAEARAKRAHFGQAPVAEVGIWFGSRTRDWRGRETPGEYFQCFQGAHKALVYAHIPWAVILDENVTAETLARFRVVCLPNVAILSEREVALLRAYVEKGGALIVTGLSGCADRMGNLQAHSALEDLAGVRFERALDSLDNHVRFGAEESPLAAVRGPAIPAGWPFLVKGPAAVMEAAGAAPYGELMKPHRTVRQRQGKEGTEWPMSADAPVGPAVFLNAAGKGKVLTFACSPDYAAASEHAVVEARQLLVNAVRLLHPAPRIRIDAPANVEAVVTDDAAARTLRIHLLGYNSPPAATPARNRPFVLPSLIEDAPMYRAAIELAHPFARASALGAGTVLTAREKRIEAVVSDVHEVIVVAY